MQTQRERPSPDAVPFFISTANRQISVIGYNENAGELTRIVDEGTIFCA
jgi:hypothetical protein